ncbi:unnamed protein product [[Candida] boidinii]|nr:unnamed protein product [[Candida] boidinii]
MKFGKYLAARQLELPEYAGHFINYKGLKKLINALIANNNVSENNNNNNNNNSNNNFNSDNNGLLKDKKGSFFFRLERELEKVNEFYLEKEAELKFRLDILIEKKNKALKNGRLNNITKNSIAFVSLYDGFKKFSQDLDRLEQFVELNETGFTKVLKKWDKRSKSRTKELYLTTAVNVQPVFHRDEIIELSDLVANHLMELEAKVEGNVVIRYDSNSKNNTNNNKSSDINDQFDENMMDGNISRKNSASTITNEGVIIPKLSYSTTSVTSISSSAPISNQNYLDNRHNQQQQQQFQQQQFQQQQQQQQQQHEKSSNDDTEESSPINDDRDSDELYTDFYDITTQNANLSTEEQDSILKEWSNQILSKLSNNSKKFTLSKVFMLLIPNIHVPDESLEHFYELFKDYIDLNIIDDLSGRNCLLEASAAKTGRNFVINLCLNNYKDNNKKFITKKDISGRNCLHYITENGRNDLLTLLLENKFIDSETKNFLLNSTDNVSISPLLLAIVHNHLTSIEILLKNGANGFPLQDDLKPTYLPLNIACKFGNDKVVKLLLQQFGSPDLAKEKKLLTHSFQTNAEGLLPLHIVASSGHDNLIPLLLEYGADINQKDKLNKWSPIFYSVTRGFASTTEKLINYGAHFDIQDEDDFTPLYYAIWEGEVDVLNILMNSIKKQKKLERAKLKLIKRNNYLDGDLEPPKAPHLKISNPDLPPSFDNLNFNTNDLTNYNANNNDNNKVDDFALDDSKQLANDFNNVEMIPDLSLPPPIIPLRKYGHNFLEKKIFLKLTFYTNRNSISLNPDTFLTSIPGRITISCVKNDLIPRNLLLPVLDLDKSITFQTDSFDGFAVDFELFPTFGTRNPII